MRLLIGSLAATLVTFTRIPIAWQLEAQDFRRACWHLPLLGALFTLLQGGMLLLMPWPPASLLSAALLLMLPILLTGALHEDGLADFCDGLLGGQEPTRRFAIMKDPRIGSFGAIGLFVTLGLSVLALEAVRPQAWLSALALSQVLPRALALTLIARLDYHEQPNSRSRDYLPARTWSWGHLYALGGSLLLLVWLMPELETLLFLLGACGVWHQLWIWCVRRTLGAYTGDVLGAMIKLGEMLLLLSASLIWPAA